MAKRRSNGEGSVTKRPNGNWQAQMTLDGKRLSKSFVSKQECRQWLREIARQKSRGLSYKGTQVSLSEYLGDWLDMVRPNVRPNTHHQYQANVRNHILPDLGKHKLSELKPIHLQSLYSSRAQTGVGSRTIQVTHAILNIALKKAKKLGLISENPAELVDRPKVRRKVMKILTDSEVRQLLIFAKGSRIETLVHLAATSGMRQGELLGLKWGDVDWERASIKVQRQLQRIKYGGLLLTNTKTQKSERTIYIGPYVVDKLIAHREAQQKLPGNLVDSGKLIFPNTRGNPLEPRRVYGEFKELLEKAGLPKIRFHDLRHTAASLMLSCGMPVIKVARQLGHAKPSTTLDVYGHLIPGLETESVAKIEDLIIPIAAELQQKDRIITTQTSTLLNLTRK